MWMQKQVRGCIMYIYVCTFLPPPPPLPLLVWSSIMVWAASYTWDSLIYISKASSAQFPDGEDRQICMHSHTAAPLPARVFNGISFREIFAKRKRIEFRNFVKIKSILAKFLVSRKYHFSENKRNETKRNETKQTKRNKQNETKRSKTLWN
jgi:hypothetical protein